MNFAIVMYMKLKSVLENIPMKTELHVSMLADHHTCTNNFSAKPGSGPVTLISLKFHQSFVSVNGTDPRCMISVGELDIYSHTHSPAGCTSVCDVKLKSVLGSSLIIVWL